MPLLADDPSLALKGRLDIREWAALRQLGISSVEDLAALNAECLSDPDCVPPEGLQRVLSTYLPEVTHRGDAMSRLAEAVQRARMTRDGIRLQRTSRGAISVVSGTVEIDFDIEWDPAGRVYLWGFWVASSEQPSGAYHPSVDWAAMDQQRESALAGAAWLWLTGQADEAERAGGSLRVFHYSHPEVSMWRRIIDREDGAASLPCLTEFDAFVEQHFVDLNALVRGHFRGIDGLGLKCVAVDGPGFAWRDDDAGGLQSQVWYGEAMHAEDDSTRTAFQQRILDYNEDDVRATQALRGWLREQ